MTVSTEIDSEEFTGNGVTTIFPYLFRIPQSSNMIVTRIDLSDVESLLVLGTDYTITGVGGYFGGNVILNAPLAAGYGLTLVRDLPITQETDLRNQGTFFAEVHEDVFDKLTMLIQQVWSRFNLALRKPTLLSKYYDALGNRISNLGDPVKPDDAVTKSYADGVAQLNLNKTLHVPEDSVNPVPSVSNRANKILAFNDSGQPIAVLPESGSASDVLIQLAASDGVKLVGGAVADYDLAASDGYKFIGECPSFSALRNIVPSKEGVKIKLRGYRSGSLLGGGWFIGHLSARTDNRVTVASSGGGYHWVREDEKNIDVFQAGAFGDGVTDDYPYVQDAINYLISLSPVVAGAFSGALIAPQGYTYKISTQLLISVPIKLHFLGNLYWSGSSGYCIRIGTGDTWAVGYDIYIRNAWADKNLSFPTTIVNGGTGLMLITSMTFSKVKIDHAQGFSDTVLYFLANGAFGYQQVVQHNTFDLGQIVNSGIGINMLSLDAASSSAQANRFYIQNIYQNYKNIVIDDPTHAATNSNTFSINAMDNCRDVGLDLYGHLNVFYIGFAGAPGTALRENSSYGNTIVFGNSIPTDLVINFGANAKNTITCANPGPGYLPGNQGITSGTAYQNTYGVSTQVICSAAFSVTGGVQVMYGKDAGSLEVVQTINGTAGNIVPINIISQPGWYWKLFTVSGSVSYGIAKIYAI